MVPLITGGRRRQARPRPRDFSIRYYDAPPTARRLSQAYRQTPASTWRTQLWWAIGALAVILLAALAYAPFFTIRNVIINHVPSRATEQRLRQLVDEVMNQHRWLVLPQSNLIFFSTKLAQQAIAREFYTQGLTFERHWPNVLKVNLAENLVVARFRVGDKEFALDRRGILVQELPSDWESPELAAVRERVPDQGTAPEHKLGDQVAPEEAVGFLDRLSASWRQELSKLPLDYVLFDAKALPTLQVFMPTGWYVLVSTQEDAATQVVAVRRLLEDKIKDDATKLEYIDVRFISRLYYKLR